MASKGQLTHNGLDGSACSAMSKRSIYWYRCGEDIGWTNANWGLASAKYIYNLWRHSPTHWALMMSSKFNYVGIGVAEATDGSTWISVIATQSPDHTPPVAANVSLRRSGTTLTFRWRGADPLLQTNTAGLRSFDVQMRRDRGAWLTLRNDTTSTSMVLRNRRRGHWFSFRVQAADRRGTLSPWTSAIRIWVP